ncbi:MAG TPA: oxygen-independent coproporphyrinogen III oxidase, partial [Casimicrobiaceae bacterium]|nr:oxygen-independent coproporphyrinogen III oxidase [Casimicrobiaceae bacterium]
QPSRSQAPLSFDSGLIRKYDGFGPRYTSYPTADRFTEAFGPEELIDALRERSPLQPLSLYVHVPFCNTICYYCACNKVVTKDHGRSAKYIRYLAKEVALLAALVNPRAPVTQLHLGGGTPTFLSGEEMAQLVRLLEEHFSFAADCQRSIEVDPRSVTVETVADLAGFGFNRMSLGVQDFDPEVQRAVNRLQSESDTLAVMRAARANGFHSLNVDLIYGLPRQTVAGFGVTLDRIIAAAPDRIALYSYAHVPHLFKPQRRISEPDLPSPADKLAILELAIDKLVGSGYVYIGMDHFAKPDDELAAAQREGRLHRNFQGYSTDADCDLLAFGVSAIGKTGATYSQNVRTLDDYYTRLDAGVLPCFRGRRLGADDLCRREVIQSLMCHFTVDYAAIEAVHGVRFDRAFAAELAALRPLASDGLVEIGPDRIDVTPRGRLLVRSVAMTFDRYLREDRERARYSRVI